MTGLDLTFDGILGLSNKDESSGDLLYSQLHSQGSLSVYQFGVLIGANDAEESVLTLSGYQAEKYGSPEHEIIAHLVSGSFHWSLSLVRYKLGDTWYLPIGL